MHQVFLTLIDLLEQNCFAIPLKISILRLLRCCLRAQAANATLFPSISLPLAKFRREIASLSQETTSNSPNRIPIYLQTLYEFLAVCRITLGEYFYLDQLKSAARDQSVQLKSAARDQSDQLKSATLDQPISLRPSFNSCEFCFFIAAALLDCLSDNTNLPLPLPLLSIFSAESEWTCGYGEYADIAAQLFADHNSKIWNSQSDATVCV